MAPVGGGFAVNEGEISRPRDLDWQRRNCQRALRDKCRRKVKDRAIELVLTELSKEKRANLFFFQRHYKRLSYSMRRRGGED